MVLAAAAELDKIVRELRELLTKVDSLLDDSLPPHALSKGRAAREQLVRMIEDFLDLIEVEEAFKEAGDERIPLDQVLHELRRA